jgi:hypothetical protein
VDLHLSCAGDQRHHHTETIADGYFRLAHDPWDRAQRSLSLAAVNRLNVWHRLDGLPERPVLALGDIPLPFGTEVRGRVVDEQHRPVANVRLELEGEAPNVSPPLTVSRGGLVTGSGEQGSFAFHGAVPTGTWRLRVHAPHTLHQPTTFELAPSELERELLVELTGIGNLVSIAGRVQDEQGAPIAGVVLDATESSVGLAGTARSGRDGGFVLHGKNDSQRDDPPAIGPEAPARCLD